MNEGVVTRLLDAPKAGRHGARGHLLLLMMFRHDLRVSEATALRRDGLDLDRARLWVRRLKGGLSVEQPVADDGLRAVKRHLATRTDALPWLFVSEPGQPLTRRSVNCLIGAAAGRAGLPDVHPHTPRYPLRLRAGQQEIRPPAHSGPPRPPRPPAHRPLHPHGGPALRGAGALSSAAGSGQAAP